MKKKKLNILLNIATICLCVCAIAIGVYSVKNASLAVTGTINFQAHDCLITVKAEMYGDAVGIDGTPDKAGTPRKSTDTLASLGTWSNVKGDANYSATNKLNSSTKYYFSDMGESGEVEDITVVFTITNNSEFPVKAMVSGATSTTLNFTDAGEFARPIPGATIVGTMPTKTDTCTLMVKISLKNKTTDSDANTFEIGLSFEKYSETSLEVTNGNIRVCSYNGNDISYSEVNLERSYVTMGKLSDNSTEDDMKWFIFAQSDSATGAMKPVTSALSSTTLPKGTYWFISEYNTGKSGYWDNEGKDSYGDLIHRKDTTDYNRYLGSNVQTTLESDVFNLSENSIYKKISARTLIDDSYDLNGGDAFVTTPNQRLWLISLFEYDYLLRGSTNGAMMAYGSQTSTEHSQGWCLRTPQGGIYMENIYYMGLYGMMTDGASYSPSFFRPAFQITI